MDQQQALLTQRLPQQLRLLHPRRLYPPGTVTCQWRKDGAPIDGATNISAITSTLNLTNIEPSATYDCVVNGFCGSAISLRIRPQLRLLRR